MPVWGELRALIGGIGGGPEIGDGRYDGIADSILAVMSFALLAHHTAAPAFNGLFYATAATIIPVLFLALVVLGPAYRKVLHSIWITFRAVLPDLLDFKAAPPRPFFPENPGRTVVVTWAVVAIVIRLLIALSLALVLAFRIAIIAAGGYGELLAVYALYVSAARPGQHAAHRPRRDHAPGHPHSHRATGYLPHKRVQPGIR